MKSKEKQVSRRVTLTQSPEAAEILITGDIDRWKVSALSAWLLAWLFCGAVVIREFVLNDAREFRLVLFVFLVFWAYYFWRIGKVWLYRKSGYEKIRITPGEVTLSRKTAGKVRPARYFIENIPAIQRIDIPEKSFAYTFENQWWVLGGEKVGFDYDGKFVRFAMQLDEKETREVIGFLNKSMSKFRGNRS